MEKPTLSKEESEVYIKIVTKGNMDDMFDFAYAVGRERLAREQINNLYPKQQQTHHMVVGVHREVGFSPRIDV